MISFNKLIINIASIKFAIFLLIFIAFSSGVGTFIPQGKETKEYLEIYNTSPIFGFLDGNKILNLALDHIYTSTWFLLALFLLGLSLALSSIRKQIPTLKASLKWIDYDDKEKFNKLKINCNWDKSGSEELIYNTNIFLKQKGWDTLIQNDRLSARKGVSGRLGPILVHTGLIILLIGSAYGNFSRRSLEEYLIPNEGIDLINDVSNKKLTLKLNNFFIEREADGIPKQYTSNIEIFSDDSENKISREAKVNHPVRYEGLTIYQADWAISKVILKIDELKY